MIEKLKNHQRTTPISRKSLSLLSGANPNSYDPRSEAQRINDAKEFRDKVNMEEEQYEIDKDQLDSLTEEQKKQKSEAMKLLLQRVKDYTIRRLSGVVPIKEEE